MEGQSKRCFLLAICVVIFYHDMCTSAISLQKMKGANKRNTERSHDQKTPTKSIVETRDMHDYYDYYDYGNQDYYDYYDYGNQDYYDYYDYGNQDIMTDKALQETMSTNERLQSEKYIQKMINEDYTNETQFQQTLAEFELFNDRAFLEELQSDGYNISNRNDICGEWENFNGTTCFCNDRCKYANDINMGIICDIFGNKYPNSCKYCYEMCSGKIIISNELASCGVCNTLKLTGSQIYHEDSVYGMGIFRRDVNGNTWTARDDSNKEVKLFYSNESKTWVVGSSDFKQAAIVFNIYTPYPQDSDAGAVILTNKTHGEFDPYLHLECISDSSLSANRTTQNPHSRQKKFIFILIMIFVGIGIAATLASAVVTKVQEKRGCLFYPSVCNMKQEIKNNLKPEVQRLKFKFESTVGEPYRFRAMVHNVFNDLMDMKNKMVELRKLENEFRSLNEKFGLDLKFLSPKYSNEFDMSFYNDWLKALGEQSAWTLLSLVYVQIPLEIVSLLSITASLASVAFAAVGAVVSIFAAVAVIVVSWLNEKKQRDELRKVKRNLIEARHKLTQALIHVKGFQIKFCNLVINPLKKFTNEMRKYDKHFQDLYDYLVSTFGSSMSLCASEQVYGKVTSTTIQVLKTTKLPPLIHFLSFKLNDLKTKIEKYRKSEKLVKLVKNNIKETSRPNDIFSLIKEIYPDVSKNVVPTEFSLLRFIAGRVLSDKDCYWGFNLDRIRKGLVSNTNYRSVPLCNSLELSNLFAQFQSLASQNVSPERIIARIQDRRFENRYQKLKFLADFILQGKVCYWGYNLALLRSNRISVSEISNATLPVSALAVIKQLPENTQSKALCSQLKICNSDWQTYVKCLLKTFDGRNICKGATYC